MAKSEFNGAVKTLISADLRNTDSGNELLECLRLAVAKDSDRKTLKSVGDSQEMALESVLQLSGAEGVSCSDSWSIFDVIFEWRSNKWLTWKVGNVSISL